jgi:hypothetical protein
MPSTLGTRSQVMSAMAGLRTIAGFGKVGSRRLFLHARQSTFRHPRSGELMRVDAPLDDDLNEFLLNLPT